MTSRVACLRCFERKQKCSRELPTCSQCQKAGVICKSGRSESSMSRGKDGALQTKSYISLLRDRHAELERLASEHGIDIEPDAMQNDLARISTSTPRRSNLHDDHPSPNRDRVLSEGQGDTSTAELNPTENEGADIARLPLSAIGEPIHAKSDISAVLSIPKIVDAIVQTYGGNPESTANVDPLWRSVALDIRRDYNGLPERLDLTQEQALKYVDDYFERVDFRYPRLPRKDVTRGVLAITSSTETDYVKMLSENPAWVFMAYLVIAIIPLLSDKSPISQSSFVSSHVLSKALKILDRVFMNEDAVDILHCLRLLVIFSLHSAAAGNAWHLVGIAMKKCIALGFHRAVRPTSGDSSEFEQRQWAFWSCYFLDRLISSALGRPYCIADRDITVSLPESTSQDRPLGPAKLRHVHLFRFALIQSQALTDKNKQPISYHLSRLFHLQSTLPTMIEPYPPNQEDYLVSISHTLQLRIIINYIIQADAADNASSGTNLTKQMTTACHAVAVSLNRPSMRSRSILSFITGYSAVTAGLGLSYWLLTCLQEEIQRNIAEVERIYEDLAIIVELLSVVARQFPPFQDYKTMLLRFQMLARARERQILPNWDSWDVVSPNDRALREQAFVVSGPDYIRALAEKITVASGSLEMPTIS